MFLVDTSVWIDHLHESEPGLVELLGRSQVLRHPMVVGELALGSMRNRDGILTLFADLPSVSVATHDEVMHLITQRKLYGRGLGLVDAHLLASVLLGSKASLWTRDKRLHQAAADLGVEYVGQP